MAGKKVWKLDIHLVAEMAEEKVAQTVLMKVVKMVDEMVVQ